MGSKRPSTGPVFASRSDAVGYAPFSFAGRRGPLRPLGEFGWTFLSGRLRAVTAGLRGYVPMRVPHKGTVPYVGNAPGMVTQREHDRLTIPQRGPSRGFFSKLNRLRAMPPGRFLRHPDYCYGPPLAAGRYRSLVPSRDRRAGVRMFSLFAFYLVSLAISARFFVVIKPEISSELCFRVFPSPFLLSWEVLVFLGRLFS